MSKKSAASAAFVKSSGNIFADLGIENPQIHKIKADLAIRLNKLIDQEGGSQSDLAAKLGLQQPHVSQIKNYRLNGFSVERIMELIVAMGVPVEIQVGELVCANAKLCVVNKAPVQHVAITEIAGFHKAWLDLGNVHNLHVVHGALGHQDTIREPLGSVHPSTVHIGGEKNQWRTLQ